MVQAKKILVRYIPADTIKTQGDYQSIQSYKRRGYDIIRNKNGNWILCRSCKVFVTLDCDGKGVYVFNMICKWKLWSGNLKRTNLKKFKIFLTTKRGAKVPLFTYNIKVELKIQFYFKTK